MCILLFALFSLLMHISQSSLFGTNYYNNGGLNLTISINNKTSIVTLNINGPSNVWYGIGFNNTVMSNTYAIIVNDSVQERTLGSHELGKQLTSSLTIISNNIINNIRYVTLERNQIGLNSSYYTFNNYDSNFNIIWAIGSSLSLQQHNERSTGSFLYSSQQTSPSSTTTPINSSGNTTQENLSTEDENDLCLDQSIYGFGSELSWDIYLSFFILCDSKEIEIQLRTQNDSWVGIVIEGNDMIDHDAIIYTTGKDNNLNASLYDYYLTQEGRSGVNYDDQQDWNEIFNQNENGIVTIISRRKWNTGDNNDYNWDLSLRSISFSIVKKTDALDLTQFHNFYGKSYKYNFETNSVNSENANINMMYLAHSLLMFISMAILVPCGVFSSVNRFLCKPIWFNMHRLFVLTAVLISIAGFIIAIVETEDENEDHFVGNHKALGLAVMIFMIIQPILGLIRPHLPTPEEKNQNKNK